MNNIIGPSKVEPPQNSPAAKLLRPKDVLWPQSCPAVNMNQLKVTSAFKINQLRDDPMLLQLYF